MAVAYNQIDFHIEDDNREQYDAQNGHNKEDVLLLVERQNSWTFIEIVDAVPADDGKSSEQDRGDPAGSY